MSESLESPGGATSRWFSSDDVPERERLAVLNDSFASGPCPCELVPTGNDRLYLAGHAITLPGLFITHGSSRGIEYRRSAPGQASADVLMLTITLAGHYRVAQRGGEFLVRPGEGWVALSEQPATANHLPGQARESLALMLPRAALKHARLDVGKLLRRPIRCDDTAVRLLLAYISGIESIRAPLPPAVGLRASEHLCDLLLLALDAGGDMAERARERGLPAARLLQLKQDILRRIARGLSLRLTLLAARHGISETYVEKLFARDGTNFSAFVLEHRLDQVRRRLRNPRFAGRSVSALVYDAGFNNLSWFNRAFRRRYGATPSDVRAAAAAAATR